MNLRQAEADDGFRMQRESDVCSKIGKQVNGGLRSADSIPQCTHYPLEMCHDRRHLLCGVLQFCSETIVLLYFERFPFADLCGAFALSSK